MLKMIKVNIALELKADPEDEDDFKDRIYNELQLLMENEELEFEVQEDESEEIDED